MVIIYLCLTCFNLVFVTFWFYFWFYLIFWWRSHVNILRLILIFWSEDSDYRHVACSSLTEAVFVSSRSSFVQSGYSTDPELSNKTWAIRGILSCVHDCCVSSLLWTIEEASSSFGSLKKNSLRSSVSSTASRRCAPAVVSSPL